MDDDVPLSIVNVTKDLTNDKLRAGDKLTLRSSWAAIVPDPSWSKRSKATRNRSRESKIFLSMATVTNSRVSSNKKKNAKRKGIYIYTGRAYIMLSDLNTRYIHFYRNQLNPISDPLALQFDLESYHNCLPL